MNNSDFEYDCLNNLDNCQFVSIFDELQEITYLKRYYNYLDSKFSSFVLSDLMRQEIEEKCNNSLMKFSKDNRYYEIKLSILNTGKSESLEAAENFDKKIKEIRKKSTLSLLRKTRRSMQKQQNQKFNWFWWRVRKRRETLAIKKGNKS